MLEDKSSVEKDRKRSIFYELRDNSTLPPSEKSVKRFEDEATLLVMAGKPVCYASQSESNVASTNIVEVLSLLR